MDTEGGRRAGHGSRSARGRRPWVPGDHLAGRSNLSLAGPEQEGAEGSDWAGASTDDPLVSGVGERVRGRGRRDGGEPAGERSGASGARRRAVPPGLFWGEE